MTGTYEEEIDPADLFLIEAICATNTAAPQLPLHSNEHKATVNRGGISKILFVF